MLRRYFGAVAIAASSVACYGPLDTAPYVDPNQLQGTWFEIAHLPRSTQEGCSGTTSTYTPISDGHFSVINQCTLPDGTLLKKNATLYTMGDTSNAKYGIDLGGFIGDYWITDAASDYRYIVVGHPSRNYLWVLSRDKHMTQADLDEVLTRAQNEGFDTSKLEYTNQDGQLEPKSNSGCSAAPGKSAPVGVAFGLGALGLVAVLRRRRR